MKRILILLIFLLCATARAQVTVVANLTNVIGLVPVTNQQLTITTRSVPTANQASVAIGPVLVTNTGNGSVTNLFFSGNIYQYTIRDPVFNTLIGQFYIWPTNASGTIQAQNCLVANDFSTFPAGAVAWAAATSDNRYAPISVALSNGAFVFGTNVWTGTNFFTNNTIFSNSLTLNGGTITNWPTNLPFTVITNVNGISNSLLNIQVATNVGTNVWVSTSGSNITINLPQAATATNGILNSNDWNTFNGKQAALGFTPVPNTRNVSTSSPLTGGGALSSDLTLAVTQAGSNGNGFLSSNDWQNFNSKASGNGTLTTTGPITGGGSLSNNLTIAMPVATGFVSGYLTNADWVTFNNKQTALNVSAPISLTGSNLTISQAGTGQQGYLSIADWNTFNGKQAGSVALSNFASLGTNYYQATNSNLTTLANSNGGILTNLTATNLVGNVGTNNLTNAIFAMLAAGANVTLTTNGATITIASSGSGSGGIATNAGIGYNNVLIAPVSSNGISTNLLTLIAPNVFALGANEGLILSNSTPANNIPSTNQPSPSIRLVGSAIVGGSPATSTLSISNNLLGNGSALGQLVVADPLFGNILTEDAANGLELNGNGTGNGAGITIDSPLGTLRVTANSISPSQVPYFDQNGFLQVAGSSTGMLPEGTNLYFTTNRAQVVGDNRYQRKGIKTITTTYSLSTNDYNLICDTTGGGFAVTLVAASFTTNVFVFKNIGANAMTLQTQGVDLIEGASAFTNAVQGESDLFQSDGVSNWRRIASFLPINALDENFVLTNNGRATGLIVTNSNTSAYSNSFWMILGGNNPPSYNVPMFGESITGGNNNFLDSLEIGQAYDLPNNYADIAWGTWNSHNIGAAYPYFNSKFGMGMSTGGGNWNYPYTNQSNYGIFDGDWNAASNGTRNILVLESTGGQAIAITGNPSDSTVDSVPQWFLSRDYHHIMITDRLTGTTNYFDFNKSNATEYVPYGPVVAKGFTVTNGGTINGNGGAGPGTGVTNLGGSSFASQGANTVLVGQGPGTWPLFTTNGSVTFNAVTAQSLSGGGAGITGLNGSSVSSGTVATNFLPANLAALAANNGGNLTNLPAPTNVYNIVYVTNSAQLYSWGGNTNVPGTGAVTKPNTVVYVQGPGPYFVPALPLAPGVQLIGLNWPTIYHTNATGQTENDLLTQGPFVMLNNNVKISGLNIVATNGLPAGGWYDAPIGNIPDNTFAGLNAFTNCGYSNVTIATNYLVENCNFYGMSDCIYVDTFTTSMTNSGTWNNCTFNSMWDATQWELGTSGAGTTFFNNCTWKALANTNLSTLGWSGMARCFLATSASKNLFIYINGGEMDFFGTNIGSVIGIQGNTSSKILVQSPRLAPTNCFNGYAYFGSAGNGISGSYLDTNNVLELIGPIAGSATVTNLTTSGISDLGPVTNSLAVWINNTLSNAPAIANGQIYVADSGTAGGMKATNFPPSGSGTVTSVTFTGDGTVLSSTPSGAVTTSGTVTASLNTQTSNTFLAAPTSGSAASPTFRFLTNADFNPGLAPTFSGANLTSITAANVTGSHTLPDGVLSTNVPLLNANNVFGGTQTLVSATVQNNLTGSNITALTLTASNGITGTTASNNANAGNLGEFVQSLVAQGSAVTCSTGTITNVTSIVLTAGDWDVDGNVNFTNAAATVTQMVAGIWPVTLSVSGMPTDGSEVLSDAAITTATVGTSVTLPRKRINTSVTTTNYLAAKVSFSAGTVKAYGQISARRVR